MTLNHKFARVFVLLCVACQLSQASAETSRNVLPGNGFRQADGLFDALDEGVFIVVDEANRDRAVRVWLKRNALDAKSIQGMFAQFVNLEKVKVFTEQGFLKRAASGKEPATLAINFSVTADGDLYAYSFSCHLKRPMQLPESSVEISSIVWSSPKYVGLASGRQRKANIAKAMKLTGLELLRAFEAARDLREKPFSMAEFNQAAEGRYPRKYGLYIRD